MKRIVCSALCIAFVGALLTACDLPGLEQNDDPQNSMSDSYSTDAAPSAETVQNYSWLIEPSVSADNIITFDGSQVDPDNELNSAYANYSVIQSDGKYGLIDYKGNIVISPEYDNFYTCWCGEITLYNVIDEKNGLYEYCSVDSSKQVVNYVADHYDNSPEYFWDSSQSMILVRNKGDEFAEEYTDKKTVVVGEAEISDAGNGLYNVEPVEGSLYGLAKNGELLLDMEYTDYYAPAYKGAGLTCIALQNSEGKWGYVSSDGTAVVEFKFDGDMSSYGGMIIDDEEKSHPYLFTGDYVPVSVEGSYGYYDIEGNCVVRTGEFEQARPVHNGRAWVRKNGLWGVIKLGEIIEEEEEVSSVSETTAATTWYTTAYTTTSLSETTLSYSESSVTTWETEAEISETEPAVTLPPETEPTETLPAETLPPETQPIETQPAETLPPETQPAENEPAE